LKAWIQNPSGSVVSSTLNFTSFSPATDSSSEINYLEMLHVVITLELDLDTSVAIVKNKAYVKNIEEEILT